ncbi:ATP-binding protein [Streptomyces alkaliterrae]|uniref:ATP-binding protein n=1 Tax=Streptomyces alkaliterrae TaxID=2213162 RepID=A0A5P0YVL3_9ACTN|nr:ATP-binding protein [Streptomyces alkaliterrae]MBB1255894.1 ATP-binding protein [Streptomyces alkaliterrae]MBB1261919.1 ATP-binding protein [Streptomyces alkaliterrae]MQS04334.1 ATP-binding protein [Streptomyces alkaliterrae]
MRMPLYARDPLLRALVPRLVGLAADRRELVPQEHRGDLPVTLLTGRHGMGRTAVLDFLERAYRGRVPVGRVDAARIEQGGRWSGSTAANTSAVVEVLEHLVCRLAPAVPGASRFRFARLMPGLFAVSSWHRGSEVEQSLARDRIARLLTACGLHKSTEDGGQWTYDVSERLADPDRRRHDLAPVTEAVVQQYFGRHTRSRDERAVHRWYQSRFPGSESGEAALIRLSLRFHQGGDFQRAVEQTLVAAFLEDLTDAYSWWHRVNRTPRPLVLLDNAHTAAGRRVLDLLLEHRAASGSGARDPLVVVATRLGEGGDLYPDATRRELPELVHTSGWERAVPGSPSAGLLVVPLTPLTHDDLLLMLDAAEGPLPRHLPSALHALTRGHPQGSRTLCEAVVRASGRGAVELEKLLDLPAEEGRRVAEVLLEQLVPQPQQRAHLVPLALARDRAAAQALVPVSTSAVGGLPGAAVPSAARYLEEELWTTRSDGAAAAATGFVPDPFLRALLIHEARATSEAAAPGLRWEDLHALLREHHAARGPGHGPDVLRHTLAVGDAEAVVSALTGYFGVWEAGRWLDALRYTAEAPRPPSDGWTDERAEIARGAHDHRHAETDDVRRSVNRLLHALWYLSETYAEPLPDLCDDLGSELTFLSMRHPSGRAVLSEAARAWPAAARERGPYPRYGSALDEE